MRRQGTGGDWRGWRVRRRCLAAGANSGQSLAEERRETGFDLRRDQAGFVQILKMCSVAEAKVHEFHANQVCHWDQSNTLDLR